MSQSSVCRLSVWMFGSFDVHHNETPVGMLRLEKAQALLAYLAAERQNPQRRELLATLLWPELPQTQSRADLRQLLHRLRGVLGDGDEDQPLLRLTADHIQLDPGAAVWVDVGAFVDLLTACRLHRHASLGRCHDCLAKMRAAAALYRGDFLQNWHLPESEPYQEWVNFKQAELHNMATTALALLAHWHATQGDYAAADGYIQQQLLLDPWNEDAHRQRMSIFAAGGDVAVALKQYGLCRRVLAEQLGIGPSWETEQLHQQIKRSAQGAQGDHEPLIRARLADLYSAAVAAVVQGRYLLAAEYIEQLAALAQRHQLADMIRLAKGMTGVNEFFRGDLQQARRHLEQATAGGTGPQSRQARPVTGIDFLAVCLHWLSWTLRILGDSRQAEECAAQALAVAAAHEPTRALLKALSRMADCCLNRCPTERGNGAPPELSLSALDAILPPWRDLFGGLGSHDLAHPPNSGGNADVPETGLTADLAWILQTLIYAERDSSPDDVHALFVNISHALALVEETGTHVFTAEFYRLRGETLLRIAAEYGNECATPRRCA